MIIYGCIKFLTLQEDDDVVNECQASIQNLGL